MNAYFHVDRSQRHLQELGYRGVRSVVPYSIPVDPHGASGLDNSYYIAGAQDVQIDGQGRLLIPPLLRDYAELGRDVVFTGHIDRFQIWNKDVWRQLESEDEQEVFDDPELLNELEL